MGVAPKSAAADPCRITLSHVYSSNTNDNNDNCDNMIIMIIMIMIMMILITLLILIICNVEPTGVG